MPTIEELTAQIELMRGVLTQCQRGRGHEKCAACGAHMQWDGCLSRHPEHYPKCPLKAALGIPPPDALEQIKKQLHLEGMIAGMHRFAWWKNGIQFVGSCGTTLDNAIKDLCLDHGGIDPRLMGKGIEWHSNK